MLLVVAITSHIASIAEIDAGGGRYAYRASKAALNAVMRGLIFAISGAQQHLESLTEE
jgi:NAD(P)-dependent dehydrogenase (short-subunit alcohol dehydrogenase family)